LLRLRSSTWQCCARRSIRTKPSPFASLIIGKRCVGVSELVDMSD
jgi:hypothetical protein